MRKITLTLLTTLIINTTLLPPTHAALNIYYDAGTTGLQNLRSRWFVPRRHVTPKLPLCFSGLANHCPLHARHPTFQPPSNAVWREESFPAAPLPLAPAEPLLELPILPWAQSLLELNSRAQYVIPLNSSDDDDAATVDSGLGVDAGPFQDGLMWLSSQQLPVEWEEEPREPLAIPRASRSLDGAVTASNDNRRTRRRLSNEQNDSRYVWRAIEVRLTKLPTKNARKLQEFVPLGEVQTRWLGDWWATPKGLELRSVSGAIIFQRPVTLSSLPVVRIPAGIQEAAELADSAKLAKYPKSAESASPASPAPSAPPAPRRKTRLYMEGWVSADVNETWIYSAAATNGANRRRVWDADFSLPPQQSQNVDVADFARASVHRRINGISFRFGLYRDEYNDRDTFRRLLDIDARNPTGPSFAIIGLTARTAAAVDTATGERVPTTTPGLPRHAEPAVILRIVPDEDQDRVIEPPKNLPKSGSLQDAALYRRFLRLSQTAEVLQHYWDLPYALQGLQQPLLRFWFQMTDDFDALPPVISSDGAITSMPLPGVRKVNLLLQRHVPVEAALVPLSSTRLAPRFEVTEATSVTLTPASGTTVAPDGPAVTASEADADVLALFSSLKASLGTLAKVALRSKENDIAAEELQKLLDGLSPGLVVDMLEQDGVRVITLDLVDRSAPPSPSSPSPDEGVDLEGDDRKYVIPVRHRRADVIAKLMPSAQPLQPPTAAAASERNERNERNSQAPAIAAD